MNCIEAHPLVGPYLDGELSENQAAPLRRHLLACVGCRTSVQSHKNLQRWFVQPEPAAVPRGFAAKVAQAAFAGEGARPALREGVPAIAAAKPAPAPAGEGRVLRFVLALTSAAAAATILVVLATRDNRLPDDAGLRASERPRASMEEALQRLEALQRAEAAQAAK